MVAGVKKGTRDVGQHVHGRISVRRHAYASHQTNRSNPAVTPVAAAKSTCGCKGTRRAARHDISDENEVLRKRSISALANGPAGWQAGSWQRQVGEDNGNLAQMP
jgi:hypothetical protein